MNVLELGFKGELTESQSSKIGRVLVEHKHLYRISDGENEYIAEPTGKFRFNAQSKNDFPAVGDFVVFEKTEDNKALISEVLPRFSSFSRQSAGLKTEEQIIAANIDYVFIVMALNGDFNSRRLERYVTLAYESGALPLIVLTKKDLSDSVEEKIQEVENVAYGVPIFAINGLTSDGIEEMKPYLQSGTTITLVGSSGVGKSTLINAFSGEDLQKTQGVRESDDRGKHTTTHRELFFLPSGAMVIDTPGMRELKMWSSEESISTTFQDIEELVKKCKFSDCTHLSEPNCAIKRAIEEGNLQSERFENYKKLQREIAYNKRRQNALLQKAEKEKWKKITKTIKNKK